MIHGRDDYDGRIQDTAGQIGRDEPVFLVRAQDEFAPHQLMDYAARCEARGLDDMAAAVRRHAVRMRVWQAAHGCRLPDVPAPATPASTRR